MGMAALVQEQQEHAKVAEPLNTEATLPRRNEGLMAQIAQRVAPVVAAGMAYMGSLNTSFADTNATPASPGTTGKPETAELAQHRAEVRKERSEVKTSTNEVGQVNFTVVAANPGAASAREAAQFDSSSGSDGGESGDGEVGAGRREGPALKIVRGVQEMKRARGAVAADARAEQPANNLTIAPNAYERPEVPSQPVETARAQQTGERPAKRVETRGTSEATGGEVQQLQQEELGRPGASLQSEGSGRVKLHAPPVVDDGFLVVGSQVLQDTLSTVPSAPMRLVSNFSSGPLSSSYNLVTTRVYFSPLTPDGKGELTTAVFKLNMFLLPTQKGPPESQTFTSQAEWAVEVVPNDATPADRHLRLRSHIPFRIPNAEQDFIIDAGDHVTQKSHRILASIRKDPDPSRPDYYLSVTMLDAGVDIENGDGVAWSHRTLVPRGSFQPSQYLGAGEGVPPSQVQPGGDMNRLLENSDRVVPTYLEIKQKIAKEVVAKSTIKFEGGSLVVASPVPSPVEGVEFSHAVFYKSGLESSTLWTEIPLECIPKATTSYPSGYENLFPFEPAGDQGFFEIRETRSLIAPAGN
jgi:hypothetical protein